MSNESLEPRHEAESLAQPLQAFTGFEVVLIDPLVAISDLEQTISNGTEVLPPKIIAQKG